MKNSKQYTTPDLAKVATNYQSGFHEVNMLHKVEKYRHLFETIVEADNDFSFYFMMDFSTMKYVFVSSKVKQIVGYSVEDILQGGLDFTFQIVHPVIKTPLKSLHERLFQFYYDCPVDERKNLKFSYDMILKRPDNSLVRIMQQSVFLEISETGLPLLDFSTITDITPFKKDKKLTLAVYKLDANKQDHVLVHEENFLLPYFPLSKRQLEVMELIAQGLTTKQIAQQLYLSIDTVKNHRKKILEISGAKNIAEALRLILE